MTMVYIPKTLGKEVKSKQEHYVAPLARSRCFGCNSMSKRVLKGTRARRGSHAGTLLSHSLQAAQAINRSVCMLSIEGCRPFTMFPHCHQRTTGLFVRSHSVRMDDGWLARALTLRLVSGKELVKMVVLRLQIQMIIKMGSEKKRSGRM